MSQNNENTVFFLILCVFHYLNNFSHANNSVNMCHEINLSFSIVKKITDVCLTFLKVEVFFQVLISLLNFLFYSKTKCYKIKVLFVSIVPNKNKTFMKNFFLDNSTWRKKFV
jgi:hypothetical protein